MSTTMVESVLVVKVVMKTVIHIEGGVFVDDDGVSPLWRQRDNMINPLMEQEDTFRSPSPQKNPLEIRACVFGRDRYLSKNGVSQRAERVIGPLTTRMACLGASWGLHVPQLGPQLAPSASGLHVRNLLSDAFSRIIWSL